MIAALARLKHRDWRLRIAGQGPLLAALQQQSRDLGIADRIEFLGFIDDPDTLADLYGSSDLLLQSSRFEGFCGSVVEALACGCGIVTTASTPNLQPWLRNAGQQDMVPIGDVDAFAAAIDRAMARPVDIVRAARTVRPLRIAAALDAHVAAFTRLCRPARRRRVEPAVDALGRQE
jgi:glycosyltransferase involved in cell wall biosynthesis